MCIRDRLKPVPNIVIPFFAFALGTGINPVSYTHLDVYKRQ